MLEIYCLKIVGKLAVKFPSFMKFENTFKE